MDYIINYIIVGVVVSLLTFIFTLFVVGARTSSLQEEAYKRGIQEGYRRMQTKNNPLPLTYTLEELFDRGFNSDFEKFKSTTNGIIYGVDKDNQVHLLFINDTDELCNYYECELLGVDNGYDYQRPLIKINYDI